MTDKKDKKDDKKKADEPEEEISKEQRERVEEVGNLSVGGEQATSTGADAQQAGEGTVTEGGGAAGGTSGN